MTFYDVVRNICQALAHHVMDTHIRNPRVMS